jgi:Nucleotidyl transferase of unknown function (DUF2204)
VATGKRAPSANLDPEAVAFYRHVIGVLRAGSVPTLVGGAWAFEAYTGIGERTKDLDLFLRPSHAERALELLRAAGHETEMTAPTWIAKAKMGEHVVDLIFSSGNGISVVDDLWFGHARWAQILGHRTRLIPIEEMIWSKGFIMERERFDGADVIHLLRAARGKIDVDRLLARFGLHWRVLLAHVTLFDYVYPSDRGLIPDRLRTLLLERAGSESEPVEGSARLCYGTFLSRSQYQADVERFGLTDARHA